MVKARNKPKVFVDADVIFAGAAAPTEHGASHVVLKYLTAETAEYAEIILNFLSQRSLRAPR